MLASLKFVEKFISLPKIKKNININGNSIEIFTYDLDKINPLLTRQGFEVDSVTLKGQGLETVVVGKIEKTEAHPNASKLQICQVNIGNNLLTQIVCGAANARQGLFVAVALPSTKLPNNLEIKSSKIREIESNGMLCSREELGLPINIETDGNGIWEIEEDCQGGISSSVLIHQLGKPIFEALGIADVILELSVTPNRPDMLCHEGISRELIAAFTYENIPFKINDNSKFSNKVTITEETIKHDVIHNLSVYCSEFSFEAENEIGSPAFFIVIDSVNVLPSPAWLRNILENLGHNSINNIVDASNYLLLAHGQPSHAFDLEKLTSQNSKEKKLILRNAKQGEKFTGLDGKERELNEADEVVCDIEGVQGLLGVLGGEHSKVTKETKKIVVEFANPNPVSVRRSSRRHARQTDASFMFEKGIDAQARFLASVEYFGIISNEQSIKPVYCGSVHSKNSHKKPEIKIEFPKIEIEYHSKAQEKILGTFIIDFNKQLNILKSLGFELSNVTEQSVKVTVPSWRSHDIVGEADLVEEFIRVVGIDCVPPSPMISPTNVNYDDLHYKYLEKISARCTSLGYNEVISLHFMRTDDYAKLGLNSINSLGEPVALMNPIIGDEPIMHTTLIPDLLRKVARNLAYGLKSGQLFHSCRTFQNYDAHGKRVFVNNGETISLQHELNKNLENNFEYHFSQGYTYSREKTQEGRPVETPRLAGVTFGNKTEKTWQNTSEIPWTLHDIISHVQDLGMSLGCSININRISDNNENNSDSKFHPIANSLHPGRRVGFFVLDENNTPVSLGWAGELHPRTMRNYEIDVPCFVFELNVAVLIHTSIKNKDIKKRSANIQKFPTISRDFAFLIHHNVTAKQINDVVIKSLENLISKETPATLQFVNIFDIYKGKGIPENKKSVAFHISLIPLERTFNDKDIQKISHHVIQAVTKELDGELRG